MPCGSFPISIVSPSEATLTIETPMTTTTTPDTLTALESWIDNPPDKNIPRSWVTDLAMMLAHARLALRQGHKPDSALWKLNLLVARANEKYTLPLEQLNTLKDELNACSPTWHPVIYQSLAKSLKWTLDKQIQAAGGAQAALVPILTEDNGWTDGTMIVDVDAGISAAARKSFALCQTKNRAAGHFSAAAVVRTSLTAMRRVTPPTPTSPRFLVGSRFAYEDGLVIVDKDGTKSTYLAHRVAILRGLKPTSWGLVPGIDLGLPKAPLLLTAYIHGRAAGLLMPIAGAPTPMAQLESIWLDRGAAWTDTP